MASPSSLYCHVNRRDIKRGAQHEPRRGLQEGVEVKRMASRKCGPMAGGRAAPCDCGQTTATPLPPISFFFCLTPDTPCQAIPSPSKTNTTAPTNRS